MVITRRHQSDDTYHAMAPGIGLDVELGRRGPIGIGVFAECMVPIFFGSRDVDFIGLTAPLVGKDGISVAPSDLEGHITYDTFQIRAGAGLRLSWLGDDD